MYTPKCCLLMVVLVCLVTPENASWFGDALKTVGSAFTKGFKNIKQEGCKILYGVVCPKGVDLLGKVAKKLLSQDGAGFMIGMGVGLGMKECKVRKEKCITKRSIANDEIFIPFSDDFTDYDFNGDKLIEFKELMQAVTMSVSLANPDQLREPFFFADADGDGVLDIDEFQGAPFVFAHAYHGIQ